MRPEATMSLELTRELTLSARSPRLCDGLTRREVLRVGGLTALGLSLPDLLRRAGAAPATRRGGKARSCIVLFLMGGPPQHSTWDPKPDAPAEIRGELPPTATNVPGIRMTSLLPQVARQADRLCLLRAGLDLRDRHAAGEISRHSLAVARGRLENRLADLA